MEPANKGSLTITIDKDMDLVAGDMLGLPATSFIHFTGETGVVQAYNATTGVTTLTKPLRFYHWGKNSSTKDD